MRVVMLTSSGSHSASYSFLFPFSSAFEFFECAASLIVAQVHYDSELDVLDEYDPALASPLCLLVTHYPDTSLASVVVAWCVIPATAMQAAPAPARLNRILNALQLQ